MKELPYEIYHVSEKRDSKSKNGDSLNYLELIEEKLVILCVSDGVGSLPQDWLASETTSKKFIECFTKDTGTITSRMEMATLAAHSEVLALAEQSSMAATLVAAVVDFNSDRIYYISIGDSRIFIVDNEKAKLITMDDSISIPVKVNNSVVIKDGILLYTHPITKAIGQREKLEFEINSFQFSPGESIILATDGVHNHGLLPNSILELLRLNNLSDKLLNAVNECSRENNDDATILILRRNDFPKSFKPLYQDTILKNLDFKSEKLYGHLLTDCAVELIERNINKKEWEVVKRCLDYIYINKLLPTREILISWLDKIVEQQVNNRDILLNIRKLIQIS